MGQDSVKQKIPQPPPGFVLDEAPASSAPPPGFILDQAAPPSGRTEPQKQGFFGAVGEDVLGTIKSIPSMVHMAIDPTFAAETAIQQGARIGQGLQRDKELGYGPVARTLHGVGRLAGINVDAMTEAAERGDTAAIFGHTILPAAFAASPLIAKGTGFLKGELGEAIKPALEGRRIRLGTEEITRAARPVPSDIDFARNLQTSLPDIAEIIRKNPIETGGGKQVREMVGKFQNKAEQIWKEEHVPAIQRNKAFPVNTKALFESGKKALNAGYEGVPEEDIPRADATGAVRANKFLNEEVSKARTIQTADALRRDLTRVTSGKFGELSSPEMEVKKAVLGELRKQINLSLESAGERSLREPNMRYGALTDLADSLERRINMAENQPGRMANLVKGIHGYLFESAMKGGGIPSVGVAARLPALMSGFRSQMIGDVLERGLTRIGKTSLEPRAPFIPELPPLGNPSSGPIGKVETPPAITFREMEARSRVLNSDVLSELYRRAKTADQKRAILERAMNQ